MIDAAHLIADFKRSLRRPTLIELLFMVAIIAVLIALLTPEVQWASSGDIRLPVRVFVFDAEHGIPIAQAHVTIFRAPTLLNSSSLLDPSSLGEYRDRFDVKDDWIPANTTEADGTAVIEFEFRTGASHKRPVTHAHLGNVWVDIRAEGYGVVVVPVRHESQPTSLLRKQKEVVVTVGMRRIK